MDIDEKRETEILALDELINRRLESAKRSYEEIVNRLWAGNAAGVFAVLGAVESGKVLGWTIIAALYAFLFWLLFVATASIYYIYKQSCNIRHLEKHSSILEAALSEIHTSIPYASKEFYNIRTVILIFSAALFTIGIAFGLIIISFNIP